MKIERTFRGLEATVKSKGPHRISGSIFLSLWLAMWALGEFFALWILLWGGWCMLTGRPPGAAKAPLETAPALATGLFLLVWLSIWTLGGVLAWRELLRNLFGSDQLCARAGELEIEHGYGLFRNRRSLPREQLIRFYLPPSKKILSAQTTLGTVEIARLGTSEELTAIALALNTEYALSENATARGLLPESWREAVSLEGEPILIRNPVTRRRQAIAMWLIFLPIAFVTCYLFNAARHQHSLGAIAVIIGIAAGFAGWGTYRLTYCRDEWSLAPGRLVLQHRRRSSLQPRFTADALQLREEKDSDGDPWYRLLAVNSESFNAASLQNACKHERVLDSQTGDPAELRSFGLWLSHRCAASFSDRTTVKAKTEDFEKLKQQLAATGRFGKWASRMIGNKPRT